MHQTEQPGKPRADPIALEGLIDVVAFVFAGMEHLPPDDRADDQRIASVIVDVAASAPGSVNRSSPHKENRSTRT